MSLIKFSFILLLVPFLSLTAHAAEPPTAEMTTGMLIKNETSPAVYVLGADNKRHAFPNEIIFATWYTGFEDVTVVDDATLASYKLGGNVTIRPGTYLVKITTDPKVYAVEPGASLRWITSEDLAVNLYGPYWNQRVIDVNDVFWPNYTRGADVEAAVHPDGSMMYDQDTRQWYIENATKFEISDEVFTEMEFNFDFFIFSQSEAIRNEFDLYIDGGDFELTDDNRYPF